MPTIASILILLLLLLLCGCTQPYNARTLLGANHPTHSFEELSGQDPDSLINLATTRNQWNTTIFITPIDGILHGPTYRRYRIPKKTTSPRNYGLLPTSESAHLNQHTSYTSEWLHTINELGDSIQTITLSGFFRTFRPRMPYWSPYAIWKRTPQEQQWSSGQTTQGQPNDN